MAIDTACVVKAVRSPYSAPMAEVPNPFDLRSKAGWRAVIGVVYLVVGGVMVAVILRS